MKKSKHLKLMTLLNQHIKTTESVIKHIEKLEESLNKKMDIKKLCEVYYELKILKTMNENTIDIKNNEGCINI